MRVWSICVDIFVERRGSLFKKVQRPSRSQPAKKSRGSVIMGGKGGPGLLSKSRGSNPNVLAGEKKSQTPKLFNPNNMNLWSDSDMDKEAQEMKAMLAALTMKNSDVTKNNVQNIFRLCDHTIHDNFHCFRTVFIFVVLYYRFLPYYYVTNR